MFEERTRANLFVSELSPYFGRTPFGGVKDRDLVDALSSSTRPTASVFPAA